MGLGGILRGLTTAAGGAEQGIANRAELERQARLQLLAQRLQDAQVQNYQSEIQRRSDQTRIDEIKAKNQKAPPRLVDPVTGTIWERDPDSGEWKPGTMAGAAPTSSPQGPVTSPKPPVRPARINVKPERPIAGTDAAGNTLLIDPKTGVARPVAGAGKPVTEKERVAASRVGSVNTSIDTIERIGTTNRRAFNEAMSALRLSHYGKLGLAAADLRNMFSSPEAQQLYSEINNVILAVSPTYGGARPTDILMNLEQAASLPGIGGGDAAFRTALRHMRDRARDIGAQAGRAAPPVTASDTTTVTPQPIINPRFDPRQP